MESKTLTLKKGSVNNVYSIDDIGLSIKKIKGNNFNNYNISFENISANKYTFTNQNKTLLIIGILLCLLGVVLTIALFKDADVEKSAGLIWFMLGLAFIVFFILTKDTGINLLTTDNANIIFPCKKNRQEEVENFITEIIQTRNKVLFEKYANPNKLLDYKLQYDNLNWLLNNRVISKEVYNKQLSELNNLFNPSQNSKSIGFN